MKRILQYILLSVVVTLTPLANTGCGLVPQQTVTENGAYDNDQWLYDFDQSAMRATATVNEFLLYEEQFRASLPKEVTIVANSCRTDFRKALVEAGAARNAYNTTKNAFTQANLDNRLELLNLILNSATKYLNDRTSPTNG